MVETGLPSRIKEHSVQTDSTQNEYDVWRPSRLNFEADSLNTVERQTHEIYKATISILNKVTTENYIKLANKLENLQFCSVSQMQGVIDIIVNKAINEPEFCGIYAALCVPMQNRIVENEFGRKLSFLKLLQKKCHENFKNISVEDIVFSRQKNLILACDDMELKKKMLKVYEIEEYASRKKSAGNCRFIGELFKLNLIQIYEIHSIFETFLESGGPLALECILTLINTIGEFYEGIYDQLPEKFLRKIEFFSTSEKTTLRIRFLLLNVLELRANSWKPRSKVKSSMPAKSVPVDNFSEPGLVSDEMQEICKNIFMSYIAQNSKEEVSLSLKNFKSEQLIEVVFVFIKHVINTDPKNCEKLGEMFVELIEKQAISISDLIGGLSMFLTTIEEDHISPDLERILSPLFINNVIQFEHLMGVFEQFQQKKRQQSQSATIPTIEINKPANEYIQINNPKEKKSAEMNSAPLFTRKSSVPVVTKSKIPDVVKPAVQIGNKLAASDVVKSAANNKTKIAVPIATKPTVPIPIQPLLLVTNKPKSPGLIKPRVHFEDNTPTTSIKKILPKDAKPPLKKNTCINVSKPFSSVLSSATPSTSNIQTAKINGNKQIVKKVESLSNIGSSKKASLPLFQQQFIGILESCNLKTHQVCVDEIRKFTLSLAQWDTLMEIFLRKIMLENDFIEVGAVLTCKLQSKGTVKGASFSILVLKKCLEKFVSYFECDVKKETGVSLRMSKSGLKTLIADQENEIIRLSKFLAYLYRYSVLNKSLLLDMVLSFCEGCYTITNLQCLKEIYEFDYAGKDSTIQAAMKSQIEKYVRQMIDECSDLLTPQLRSKLSSFIDDFYSNNVTKGKKSKKKAVKSPPADSSSKPASIPLKSTNKAVENPSNAGSSKPTSIPSKPTNKVIENPSNASSSKVHTNSVPVKPTNKIIEKPSTASSSKVHTNSVPVKPTNKIIEKPSNANSSKVQTNSVPVKPTNKIVKKPSDDSSLKQTSVPNLKEQFVSILETSSVDNSNVLSQEIRTLSIPYKEWEQLIDIFMQKILHDENFVQTGALLTCKLQTLKIGNNNFGNLVIQRCVAYVLNYLLHETEKKVIVNNMPKKERRKLKTFTADQEKELLLLCKFISYLYGYSLLSKSLLLDIISSFCDGISMITNLKCLYEIYKFGFEEKDASIRETIKNEIRKPVRRMMNDCIYLMPPALLFKLQTFMNAVEEES